MPTRKTPTVLVVGGGFAGRAAVRTFLALSESSTLHIVLVDDKSFFEFTPALPRCVVEPNHLPGVTFAQSRGAGAANEATGDDDGVYFVQGRVTHLSHAEAAVERRGATGGTSVISIPFDYCVWAPGVAYAHPFRTPFRLNVRSVARRRADLFQVRARLLAADHVLVVGAGPVGVELMAELTYLARTEGAPGRLTLAASPRGLLPRLPRAAARYATRWLRARGVQIVYARLKPHRLLPDGRHEYRDIAADVCVCADVALDCTGPRSGQASLALVAGGLVSRADVLADGVVAVLPTLQVAHDSNVFAAGDAARVPGELEPRLLAEGQDAGEDEADDGDGEDDDDDDDDDVGAANAQKERRGSGARTGWGGEKTAYAAEQAGALAARNIIVLMRDEGLLSSSTGERAPAAQTRPVMAWPISTGARKRVRHRPMQTFPRDAFPLPVFPRLFIVSLHRRHGVLCVGPLVITGWLPAACKVLVETLGVPAARADGVPAVLLGLMDWFAFVLAAVLQVVSDWRGRRRRRRQGRRMQQRQREQREDQNAQAQILPAVRDSSPSGLRYRRQEPQQVSSST